MLIAIFLSALIVLSVVLSVSMELVTGVVKVLPMTVLLLMIIGLTISLCFYWFRQRRLSVARTWPHVMGRVTGLHIHHRVLGRDRIRVEYSYLVNDIDYTNDVFDYASFEATEGMLRAIPEFRDVASVQDIIGQMVRVFYKPGAPYRSSISRRFEQDSRIITVPAIVVILSATFFLSRIVIDYFGLMH